MSAKFACRVLLYSLSGIALFLGWPGAISSFFCTWAAVTCLWTLLELLAMKLRCHSMPFLFRLFLSYAITVLAFCCTLMTNLETPIDTLWETAASSSIHTISVVLPCANESFVERTVESIRQATPKEELLEIIIVDDASWPPVTSQVSRKGFLSSQLRIIRQVPAAGLIRSKKRGADAAKGDAIIFLDCHVRPMPNWTLPLLSELRANPRRIAVPLITGLNPDTWEEVSPHEGGKKMCITWSVDFFWCNELPGLEVPILSGGLLAISRKWWHESGGYDPSMRSWGGENIDQSLRTWLCGGEIVYAEGSRVAHMWRDPGNPKTMLHYAIPEGDVLRNRLRAAMAWMGPWVQKVQSFQEFQDIEAGSLANFDDIKSRLQCGTFQDYLLRFEDLFVGTGMLPSSVFHLKDMNGKCLTLDLYTKKLYLHDCIADCEGQIWHRSNSLSKEDLQCCSGLKLWNYNYCLSWYGGDVQAVDCYFGSSPYQSFGLAITESGEAMITAPALKDEQYCLNSGTFSRPVALLDITRANRTSTLELLSPGIFRVVTSSGLCLVSKLQAGQAGQAGVAAVEWGSCASAAALEVIGDSEGRKQLQVDDQCLDAAQGTGISLYPCHPPEERLPNQVFIAEEGGPLCWPFGDADDGDSHLRCLSEGKLEEPEVVLQPCANLPGKSSQEDQGQVFLKRSHGDSFILQSASGKCLSADLEHPVNVNGDEAFFLAMGKCSQRWMHQENAIAMKLRGDLWCLAASDFQRPVLTSCWPDDLTQHFETQRLGNSRVALRKRPHWADSGRERFPALCLDTSPSHRIPIITAPCGAEQALWTTEWEEVPLETQLFKQHKKVDQV